MLPYTAFERSWEGPGLIRSSGGPAIAVRCDVRRDQDVRALVATAVDAFGGLNVAYNNAGMTHTQMLAADIAEEEFDPWARVCRTASGRRAAYAAGTW